MYGRNRDKLDENRDHVRKLYRSGLTDQEIADEAGTSRQAVSLWRQRNSLARNSRKGRIYATWHRRAAMLLLKGWTLDAVCEHVGKRRDTVQTALRRMRKNGTLP